MKDKIRIILADDHEIVRTGIKLMLSYEHKFQVVGEANSGKEVINLAKTLNPDIAILDIIMPDTNGIEAAIAIRKHNPKIKIALLTALNDYHWVEQALSLGADGYIVKDIKQDEIVEALNKIIIGKRIFCQSVLKFIHTQKVPAIISNNKPLYFTKRELEVLSLIADGKSNFEIANILNVATVTADYYTKILKKKTGCSSRAGLVKYAIFNNN